MKINYMDSAALPLVKNFTGHGMSERLRKHVSLVIIVAVIIMAVLLPKSPRVSLGLAADAIALLAVMVAMLGRIWCALYIAGRKNSELCQDGPYSLVRNPLYVFSFIGAIGIVLASHRWPLVPVVAACFILYYRSVIKSEESRLVHLFPQAYPAYCNEVPRAMPRIHGFRTRTQLSLDPRIVVRAIKEVIWFPIALVAVVLLVRLF
jgi:protein-S-isoprenylcysteine O-methyltransferase Ste14